MTSDVWGRGISLLSSKRLKFRHRAVLTASESKLLGFSNACFATADGDGEVCLNLLQFLRGKTYFDSQPIVVSNLHQSLRQIADVESGRDFEEIAIKIEKGM